MLARICSFTGLAMVSLLGAAAASAQGPPRRAGLWVRVGAGYGSANSSCDTCASGARTGGVTAFVQAGGTLSSSVRLGATLEGWLHSSGGTPESMTTLAASLDYYPFVSRGFFITGGLGLSRYRANTSPALTGIGWGVMLGLGDDLRVSRTVLLTPVASLVYGGVGDVTVADGGALFATGWKQDVFRVGLGVTFQL